MNSNEFATPDVAQENMEAVYEERDEIARDRYTEAEMKELELEHKMETAREVAEAQEEARNNVAIDHANDNKI